MTSADVEPAVRTAEPVPAVAVRGLTRTYGERQAVAGIDLDVRAGETFGFLGPNGAGKSTTINMLCTLVRPSAGVARVAGHDVMTAPHLVRRSIGLVFQDSTLDGYISAQQNLRFHAELYGLAKAEASDRMHKVLTLVDLWDRRGDLVRTFSGGMKRRLEIARGLLHSPRVLFLDEPTIGLDPQTRAAIWAHIGELKQHEDITIFMTTHYMDEAEYCDRIAIIDQGRVVALGTPAELKAAVGKDRIQLETEDAQAAVVELRDRLGVEASVRAGKVMIGAENGEKLIPQLFSRLSVPILSVNIARPTLDDVFLSYTGTTIREAETSQRHQRPAQARKRAGG